MLQTQGGRPTPELDEALAALPEKYRDPVCLRYLEQRPLEEVARRLGCGVDAARMRISRGVEKLRDVLDRRGAGCALAVLTAILGEGLVEAVPSGLASRIAAEVLSGRAATAHASTIAVLGRQVGGSGGRAAVLAAALLLVVVSALSLAVWVRGGPESSRARVSTRGAFGPVAAALPASPGRGTVGPESLTVAVIAGRILCLPDGLPAPGLRVHIEADADDVPEMTVFSGNDGSFRAEVPAGSYRVQFHSLELSSRRGLLETPMFFAGQAPSPRVPAGFYYPEHELETTYPSQVEVEARPDRPGVVEFRVRPSRLISGRIRSPDGRIPERAMAILCLGNDHEVWVELEPEPDGRFEIPHVFEGGFPVDWLKIEAAGFLPGRSRAFEVPPLGDVTQLDVPLGRGLSLIGGVEDPEGRAVVNAHVSLHAQFSVLDRHDAPNYAGNAESTDEHGRFRLEGLVAGSYRLVVEERPRRYAPKEIEIEVRAGAEISDAGRIVLEPGQPFAGRVVDSEGKPVRQAEVVLLDTLEVRDLPRVRSDVDGRFVFKQVRTSGGRVRNLSVSADGFLPQDLNEVPCDPEVVVTLEPSCLLEVNLFWTNLGGAPRTVLVSLGQESVVKAKLYPGSAHPVKFDRLRAGDYSLRVTDLAGRLLAQREVSVSGGRTGIELRW